MRRLLILTAIVAGCSDGTHVVEPGSLEPLDVRELHGLQCIARKQGHHQTRGESPERIARWNSRHVDASCKGCQERTWFSL